MLGLDVNVVPRNSSIEEELRDVKPCYCGIFWSWWLVRYLIARQWGCPLDEGKLSLLQAFCLWCPIVGERDGQPGVMPKPAWPTFATICRPSTESPPNSK